jgi:3-dehydroquinate synthase
MKTLCIRGVTGSSAIHVGERLRSLEKYLPRGKLVIITDTNVQKLYGKEFPPCNLISIGTGEAVKNLDTVQAIYTQLIEFEADRSTYVLGIGGGIVCDVSGFAASTYLRGLKYGFVPTTLLSQVDASVGGKNGVNFAGYKNMVGVFNQPEFVICDLRLLRTLPERELACGFAEIIKHAAIADAQLFSYLEEIYPKAFALDEEVIEKLVYESVVIKSTIVNRDEREKGERRKLNFGHTIGHAIEKITTLSHGEAVGVGMGVAAALSVRMGLLTEQEARRLEALLGRFRLPTHIDFDREKAVDALRRDKKRAGDEIHFVLLEGIGRAVVQVVPIQELESVVYASL